jgi:hypothetical protein
VLEPQPWKSYQNNRNVSEVIILLLAVFVHNVYDVWREAVYHGIPCFSYKVFPTRLQS